MHFHLSYKFNFSFFYGVVSVLNLKALFLELDYVTSSAQI